MAAKNMRIKELGIALDVKNNGVEFEVKNDGRQLGDLYVTKTGLIWCDGKTNRENGIKITWDKFIELVKA